MFKEIKDKMENVSGENKYFLKIKIEILELKHNYLKLGTQ